MNELEDNRLLEHILKQGVEVDPETAAVLLEIPNLARGFGHFWMGTEHALLALIRKAKSLDGFLGPAQARASQVLEELSPREDTELENFRPTRTPNLMEAINQGVANARFHTNSFTSGDFLLGILANGQYKTEVTGSKLAQSLEITQDSFINYLQSRHSA